MGVLPLDAFTKGITASGSYTLHFSHLFAWEILQGTYSLKVDTSLADELDANGLRPSPFEVLDWYVTSNVIYKPLYWKGAWRNSRLVRGEMFLTTGGAYGQFTRSRRPGVNVGAGMRFFTTDLLSIRFDTRYLWFFGDDLRESFDVKAELWLGLGVSLSF